MPEPDYPNLLGDELWQMCSPLVDTVGDPEGHLWVYTHGLGLMLKKVDDIARDGDDGEPGWSQTLDLTRAKTEWLPWIGQWVGYTVPAIAGGADPDVYHDAQCARIVSRSSHRRGTVAIMSEVTAEHLNPPKTVIIQERVGDPDHITVWVYASQIATSAALVEAAARSQKAAGLLMDFIILPSGTSYNLLQANSATYTIMLGKFVNYSEVNTNPGK
jgi:hypothetical protein